MSRHTVSDYYLGVPKQRKIPGNSRQAQYSSHTASVLIHMHEKDCFRFVHLCCWKVFASDFFPSLHRAGVCVDISCRRYWVQFC